MKDIISFLNNLGILVLVRDTLGIMFMALGIVYVFGRMLELVKHFRVKNSIAFVLINVFTFFYLKNFRLDIVEKGHFFYSFFLHTSISYIWYVLIGFHLVDRVDSFLDGKGFKDKNKKYSTKKR